MNSPWLKIKKFKKPLTLIILLYYSEYIHILSVCLKTPSLCQCASLFRVFRGPPCGTWLEKYSTVDVWQTTMTSDCSTPLPKCGSMRRCPDPTSTSIRAITSPSAPVWTSTWPTFRWLPLVGGWGCFYLFLSPLNKFSLLHTCLVGIRYLAFKFY